jgi:hypothetical protein
MGCLKDGPRCTTESASLREYRRVVMMVMERWGSGSQQFPQQQCTSPPRELWGQRFLGSRWIEAHNFAVQCPFSHKLFKEHVEKAQNERQCHEDNPEMFDDAPSDMPRVSGNFDAWVKRFFLNFCQGHGAKKSLITV